MKGQRILVVAALLALVAFNAWREGNGTGTTPETAGNRAIQAAYENRQGDLQVQGEGVVDRVLPDDTHGSRHQRFIVRLPGGLTVLVAHNIDLAPRVAGLAEGDRVSFFGEYEWNERGGVVHWTHHDPGRRHVDGWIRHNGKTYQ
ncbi:DUF3465 domain-containing protein [Marinihelvus fidelis]|uniref:DUF3465 domain-containing protein n=2 Tax=Marinihelvus fidelis TaxID=2613842 RepID=A0A5N0T7T2_9GAMM|nr:DUF3465 domain-containing protein [Marinihelvus fidelis]